MKKNSEKRIRDQRVTKGKGPRIAQGSPLCNLLNLAAPRIAQALQGQLERSTSSGDTSSSALHPPPG